MPAITFTDHAELTTFAVSDDAAAHIRAVGGRVTDGIFEPPPLDVAGYLASVEQWRAEFVSLRIRAGVELGDPHLHPQAAATPAGSGFVREYMAEVTAMVETSEHFDVLAHVNYAA